MSGVFPNAKQPLSGLRIVVSRASRQAGTLSSGLRDLGAEVLEIPFIEIRRPTSFRPLDDALGRLREFDWLILTSSNGVSAMFARMQETGRSMADLAHLRIAAIGPATSRVIEKQGLTVNVVPDEYVAESVVACLKSEVQGCRVLLVRAKVARDVIPQELQKAGAQVEVIEAYETVTPEGSGERLRTVLADPRLRPNMITFTSSSTAKNFADMLGAPDSRRGALQGVRLASIGPVTSATLKELGLRVDIEAAEYTVPGLIQAIVQFQNS